MKKIWEVIKRWLNLDHQRPWEKKPPSWEDTAPSEYEPPDDWLWITNLLALILKQGEIL